MTLHLFLKHLILKRQITTITDTITIITTTTPATASETSLVTWILLLESVPVYKGEKTGETHYIDSVVLVKLGEYG